VEVAKGRHDDDDKARRPHGRDLRSPEGPTTSQRQLVKEHPPDPPTRKWRRIGTKRASVKGTVLQPSA
jgi:hypothetical protein